MNEDLREKDIAVLRAIQDGATTVPAVKEATSLTNREINYSLMEYSLEEIGLVEVGRSAGREWREIDGEEKFIWSPKQVRLTDEGIAMLATLDPEDGKQYEQLNRRELVEEVHDLEERIDRLESVFKDFRARVMDRL